MTSEKTNTAGATAGDTTSSPAPVSIDRSALNARWEEQRQAEAQRLKAERAVLLEALRKKGIDGIEAWYDGYGDSGNVGEIALTPAGATLGALAPRVADFIWDVAYGQHPGFEINDGGEGCLVWDLAANRVDLEHADFYTARNEYLHEDI